RARASSPRCRTARRSRCGSTYRSTSSSDRAIPSDLTTEIALLRHALAGAAPLPQRRVFVNRALRMERIRCIGFDLDWTVAPYYPLPIEELVLGLSAEPAR